MKAFSLIASALVASAGCGLISTDITDVDLSLPEKELTVDTNQWELTEADTFPAIDCSENAGVCAAGITELCGADGICFASCEATEQTCTVQVLVTLFHTFDLAAEKPELSSLDGKPLVNVEITKIGYTIDENTMNIDSPDMEVYVAPASVMSPGDPQAQAIGTIPSVSAMNTVSDGELMLTASGRETLSTFMKNYNTPFNLILGSEILVGAGDPVPTGRLVATVKVEATAGL